MPMSSAGRAVNSNGCVTKPKECGIGLRSCFVPIQSSSLTGSYAMATAEQWEPYESRGSRTVLGEPGGESPPGHSSMLSKKYFLVVELNFSAPHAHPTCADVRGHIESQESDHRASYLSYRGLQQRRQLKTDLREI